MNIHGWDLESKKALGILPEFNFTLTDEWIQEEEIREKKFKEFDPFPQRVTNLLKNSARSGVPMSTRRLTWLVASKGIDLLSQHGDVYEAAVQAMKTNGQDKTFSQEELFGGSISIVKYLPESIIPSVTEFLKVVWINNKGIEYSPLIPTISIILLLFMEPPLAYLSIQSMINRSRDNEYYFTLDQQHFHNLVLGTEILAFQMVHDVAKHANELNLNIAYITLALMPAFFLPFMPLPVALTIFDSFIVEGRKILTRCIIQLFKQAKKKLLATKTQEEFINVIVEEMDNLSSVKELKSFLEKSFNIHLERNRHMHKLEKKASEDSVGLSSLSKGAAVISNILGKMQITSANLLEFPRAFSDSSNALRTALSAATSEEMKKMRDEMQEKFFQKALPTVHARKVRRHELRPFQVTLSESDDTNIDDSEITLLFTNSMLYSMRNFIPHVYQRHNSDLIYKMSRDGTSFRAFEASVIAPVPHILLIKTNKGNIIGAYISDPPNPTFRRQSLERYFGNPTMFVFKVEEVATCYKVSVPPNKSFISIDRGNILIGGPQPAIFILDAFSSVVSKPCDTFGSPSLLTDPEGEKILEVELYQLSLSFDSFTRSPRKSK